MAILINKGDKDFEFMYGKALEPIDSIILEADKKYEKDFQETKLVFNHEISNKFAERAESLGGISNMKSVAEGGGAENLEEQVGFGHTIYHNPYMGELTITKEMLDDSTGIDPSLKNKSKRFVKSYYNTISDAMYGAFTHAYEKDFKSDKAVISCVTGDDLQVFHNKHILKNDTKFLQSNYYCGEGIMADAAATLKTLSQLRVFMRTFKGEDKRQMGYQADTVLIPSNNAHLEEIFKVIAGSERVPGNSNNDININMNNWNIMLVPNWETDDNRFILMSSNANEELMGNMFYQRVKLNVKKHEDYHTRNVIYNSYCRFGVGFNNWRHAIMCVEGAGVANATTLR